ncbi:oxygenase MpaB family protein [Leptospira koniambonensis]|uniref:oxygenase MpaB family protein n=1 Tax=Leptospira koniambonensis TaxID=2484950 RepID=UPI003EB83863
MFNRLKILKQINELDAEKDAQKIVFLSGSYDFPQDVEISLAISFFRTFAIPSISKILNTTKRFESAGQKRYDDTALILAEFIENGLDSERGREAMRRLNQIHKEYNIKNEDFLYTLTTFIFEPDRWNQKFGWRKSTEKERLANFYLWKRIGKMMNIKNIPETYEEMLEFNLKFEKEKFRRTPDSEQVALATMKIASARIPKIPGLEYLVYNAVYSLMDNPLREAMGFPKANPIVAALTYAVLKLRAFFLRYFWPPRKTPYYVTKRNNPTYPNGYLIEELGPH